MPLRHVTFTGHGKRLMTYNAGAGACFWDPDTGRRLPNDVVSWKGAPVDDLLSFCRLGFQDDCVNFTPDGHQVVVAAPTNTVRVLDAATGRALKAFRFASTEFFRSAMLSPRGRLLAVETVTDDLPQKVKIHLFGLHANEEVRVLEVGAIAKVGSPWDMPGHIAFSPDEKRLACASQDTSILIWDLNSGRIVHRLPGVTNHPVGSVAYSPDGRYLVASRSIFFYEGSGDWTGDSTIDVWHATTGQRLGTFGGGVSLVYALAFDPTGRIVAVASNDISLWEVASGKELYRFSDPDAYNPSHGIAFCPDGERIASGMHDGTALIWSLAPPGCKDSPGGSRKPLRLNDWWADLASADASHAYSAVWSLSAVPDTAIPFLRERIRPMSKQDGDRIRLLIVKLDDDRFEVRENATRALRELGWMAEPALSRTLAAKPSPEVRSRIKLLLESFPKRPVKDPQTLRDLRSVWVLERIGTVEACAFLRELKDGDPDDPLKEEARLAYQRVARKLEESQQ
jgi:WD40 repeat protein